MRTLRSAAAAAASVALLLCAGAGGVHGQSIPTAAANLMKQVCQL